MTYCTIVVVQADAREQTLQAQAEHAETKILLKRANMELQQAAATTRTQAIRQEHTESIQQELSKARAEIQELLTDNRSDEITRLMQQLSEKILQCTREMARFRLNLSCA
jgi:hypothetical protein